METSLNLHRTADDKPFKTSLEEWKHCNSFVVYRGNRDF